MNDSVAGSPAGTITIEAHQKKLKLQGERHKKEVEEIKNNYGGQIAELTEQVNKIGEDHKNAEIRLSTMIQELRAGVKLLVKNL